MRSPVREAGQKQVIVVLGMARSGTSAIARGLKALGICLGDHLTPGNERWNQKGFWEDTDIVYKINRGVLYALDHPLLANNLAQQLEQNTGHLRDLRDSAVTLLKQRIAATQYWGFKDPRTARLLPFWQQVFTAANVSDNYVIALRNPLASAYSYQTISGCDLEEALIMWLMHMVPAIENSHGKSRVVVSYDLLMQDPHLQLGRTKLALDLPDLADSAELDVYANDFLDKRLHHHECSTQDLKSNAATAVVPLCLTVYELLQKLAKDELKFDDPEFISGWQDIREELARVYPIYNYIDSVFKRSKQLERKIRTTNKSILWKMLYPLRVIDDALRMRRHKAREKRRLVQFYE